MIMISSSIPTIFEFVREQSATAREAGELIGARRDNRLGILVLVHGVGQHLDGGKFRVSSIAAVSGSVVSSWGREQSREEGRRDGLGRRRGEGGWFVAKYERAGNTRVLRGESSRPIF